MVAWVEIAGRLLSKGCWVVVFWRCVMFGMRRCRYRRRQPHDSRGTASGRGSVLRDGFVVGALIVFMGGPVMYLARHVLHGEAHPEDPVVRGLFAWTAAMAVLAVLLDSQRVSGRRLFRPRWWTVAVVVSFTVAIVASSTWSIDPAVTRARSLVYVGMAALAWIVADLGAARLRRALLTAVAAVLAGGVVTSLVSDAIGRDSQGDWQGLFAAPAELAVLAGLALLLVVPSMVRRRGRFRLPALMLAVGAFVALVGSASVTVWVGLVVAVVASSALWSVSTLRFGRDAPRVQPRFGSVALATSAASGLAVAGWVSSTLGSRRAVWDSVWDTIAERPIVGYGWFTVWDTPSFVSTHGLADLDRANNSFSEVWLGAGLLALVPFVAVTALALWSAAQTLRRCPTADSWCWFALVVFLVVINLLLSSVLWYSYTWVLLTSAALRCGSPAEQSISASAVD